MGCPIVECLNTPPSDQGPLCHDHTLALDVLRWGIENDEDVRNEVRVLASGIAEAIKEAKVESKPSKKSTSEG